MDSLADNHLLPEAKAVWWVLFYFKWKSLWGLIAICCEKDSTTVTNIWNRSTASYTSVEAAMVFISSVAHSVETRCHMGHPRFDTIILPI